MTGDDNHDRDHPKTSNPSPSVPPLIKQIPHTVSSIKLPILKKGEYDIWAMKMEHYLSHTYYPIWQVIHNGNGPISVTTDTNGMIKVLPSKTVEEVVARERERKARNTLLMALPEDHLAKFHKMANAKEMWEAIKSKFGLHKGYDRFQTLLSQLKIHGAGVLHEDENQKFLRSLPSSWSQVALIMRTKPGLDTLSFDDPYNNLRVFKHDVKGITASSSNTQNVAFVSTDNTSSTNDVSTAYSVSSSISKTQKEGSSSYTNEVIHSFFANQSSAPQLDYDDLEQINDDDMEEMDLKWQVAIISMRIKKFHKRTGRTLQFDTKDLVGFDKTKVECFNCHKIWHFARDCRAKGNQDTRRKDVGYNGNKARDNCRRPAYQDDSKALVTIDGEDIDWSGHVEEDAQNYAMMAYSSSNLGSDNEVKSCSKTCKESYARLKKLYDEQRDKLGDPSVEITAYTLALKRLLNIQISANDKFGLGYGDYRYGSILSYENEVLQSVFINKESDLEDTLVNDRYAEGMHATSVDESDSKPSEYATYESDSSVETTTSMPEPVKNAPKVVCEPKVWTDAPIIEEENVKEIGTPNHSPKVEKQDRYGPNRKGLGFAFTRKACFVCVQDDPHRALKDKEIVDSRCSRHMTGNKAHLADYQEFKGGSVAFGGSNRRITSKGKIKAGKLDFEDVYYVEELQNYNLFSVSQMCDKKNKVLFTDTDLLSLDFKLPNENQKGKKHKASCKAKTMSFVNQPLQTLHMDLFRPTSVRSINHKTYCLVITDGFSRVLVTKPQNKTLYELFTGKGHAWMFDLDYLTNSMNYELVLVENQANKSLSPKEANNSAGTQANDDQGANSEEINLHEEHLVLPIWSAYSATIKSLGDKIEKTTDVKSCEKPVSQVEQIFLEELKKLKRQEKEANVAARKETSHENQDAYTNNTKVLNTVSKPLSAAGPSRAFNDGEPSYLDDHSMPHIEDIYASPSEGIFTDSSYDDEGVISQALEDESWVDAMQEELLQFKIPKSAFLYGTIDEEVYVTQLPCFVDPKFPNNVYKVVKALYGLHQAPRAWYSTLSSFLEKNGIIFGSTKKSWCDEFKELMKNRFQMSSMGELTFFLGLQVKQKEDGIFISQDKYVAEILKKFDFLSVKAASTPIETQKPLVKDEEAADVFQVTLKISHLQDMKRIFRRLILWQCKEQTTMATSTTKAEYFAAAHCCGQVLWIQNQLLDYGFNIMNTKIYIDNESTICIMKNPVFHSKTKHIKIRHHFIRDAYEKKLIQVLKIHTDDSVADLLTKAFDVSRIFECWSKHHTTNGHQFTMSNPHQELTSLEANSFCKELASPKQTAIGKDISNRFMAGSLPKTIW
uniref:CCHC-type domain-containing protein n=1 Tax=Tanacetum cinerariifolium TaxID=118510 RepID=A0A6L2P2T4_TANCI|nr:hypothetical protein [Tanacetum cinerariifolium]